MPLRTLRCTKSLLRTRTPQTNRTMLHKGQLPELLAPAGSPDAFRAALEGGADAIYFGGTAFNARLRAENFTAESMRDAISLCHAYGAKAYLALNTLMTDRELPAMLDAVEEAYLAGADALIVADLGAAAAIHRHLPDLALHASTQCSGHNVAASRELAALGFSRMVLARETPADDIRTFLAESRLEAEVFVHGALCVSHSGQCLFSSLVGGRSGNRGECAQPCRLPDARGRYPLSLKDLSLACHVPTLIEMGVDSLKLEGRLKSPAYVREVTAAWRRLLDERRAATPREMEHLAAVFSRGGFTDAYFCRKIGKQMMGYRSEDDKSRSLELAPFKGLTRRVPLTLSFVMQRNTPLSLTASAAERTVTVTDEPPLVAERAPMDRAAVERSLSKLGGTPYMLAHLDVALDEGLMVPVSRLNALRRAALAALTDTGRTLPAQRTDVSVTPTGTRVSDPTARFEHAEQITESARSYFAHCYLPLHAFAAPADGVVLPPVIFDSEREGIARLLKKAVANGATHALVGNIGHLSLAREAGLVPHGDFRLNVCNKGTLDVLLSHGLSDVLLSPELTLPQIRDVKGSCDVIVYGRIPLMLLEKCAGREVGDCAACERDANALIDRRGERFPILRLPPHRNILVNSRPTVMSDRQAELARAGITGGHYIFTLESPDEVDRVIDAYQGGTPLGGPMRRI